MGIEDTKVYAYCKQRFGKAEDWPEILENLDEVYHTGIIGNKEQHRAVEDVPLIHAFVWNKSPHGDHYWRNLYGRIVND